jgi:hypothetical protein
VQGINRTRNTCRTAPPPLYIKYLQLPLREDLTDQGEIEELDRYRSRYTRQAEKPAYKPYLPPEDFTTTSPNVEWHCRFIKDLIVDRLWHSGTRRSWADKDILNRVIKLAYIEAQIARATLLPDPSPPTPAREPESPLTSLLPSTRDPSTTSLTNSPSLVPVQSIEPALIGLPPSPSTMVQDAATFRNAMPPPTNSSAPHFTGRDERLKDFFEDYEFYADQSCLDDTQKVSYVVRYVTRTVREEWQQLQSFTTPTTWDDFKKAVIELYPNAEDPFKYSFRSLRSFVSKRRDNGIRTYKEWAAFHRGFQRQSKWLKKKKIIGDLESQRLYFQGLSKKLRTQVTSRIMSREGHPALGDPFTEAQIEEAVRHIFQLKQINNAMVDKEEDDEDDDRDEDDGSDDDEDSEYIKEKKRRLSLGDDEKWKSRKRHVVRIKEEPEETAYMPYKALKTRNEAPPDDPFRNWAVQFQAQNERIATQLNQMTTRIEQALNANVPPRRAQQYNPPLSGANAIPIAEKPQLYPGCHFCGNTDHIIRDCPIGPEYIRTGKAVKIEGGRYATVDGKAIPSGPRGEPLKNRIDAYNKRLAGVLMVDNVQGLPSNRIEEMPGQAFIVEVDSTVTPDEDFDDEKAELLCHLQDLVATLAAEDGGRPQGAQTRSQTRANQEKPTQPPAKSQSPTRNIANAKSSGATYPDKIRNVTTNHQPEAPSTANPPRYQLKSQAESAELIDELVKMVLDNRLNEIKLSHLLAASHILRSKLISYLRSHRVEVNQLVPFFNFEESNNDGPGPPIGMDSVPLAEIAVETEGIDLNAVLDDGCAIIVVRRDLWEEIGNLPLFQKEGMQMETADTSTNATLGRIRDLPIKVGGIIFHLRAQVVARAPCKLLLGKPFLALAEALTHTQKDGKTTITLTNPTDPTHVITIPTMTRGRYRRIAEINMFNSYEESGTPIYPDRKGRGKLQSIECRAFFG